MPGVLRVRAIRRLSGALAAISFLPLSVPARAHGACVNYGDLPRTISTLGVAWGGGQRVDVSGPLACVAAGNVLDLINVSDPAAPTLVSAVQMDPWDVVIRGIYVYAAVAGQHRGLRIVDVSNPAAPVTVGGVATAGDATTIDVRGNLVFLGCTGA